MGSKPSFIAGGKGCGSDRGTGVARNAGGGTLAIEISLEGGRNCSGAAADASGGWSMLVGDAVIGGSGAATICGADDSVGAAKVIGAKADVCWAAGCIGGGGGANTGVGGMAIMPEDGGGVSCMDCGAGGGAEGCAAGDMRTAAGGGNAPVVSGSASSIEGSAAALSAPAMFSRWLLRRDHARAPRVRSPDGRPCSPAPLSPDAAERRKNPEHRCGSTPSALSAQQMRLARQTSYSQSAHGAFPAHSPVRATAMTRSPAPPAP